MVSAQHELHGTTVKTQGRDSPGQAQRAHCHERRQRGIVGNFAGCSHKGSIFRVWGLEVCSLYRTGRSTENVDKPLMGYLLGLWSRVVGSMESSRQSLLSLFEGHHHLLGPVWFLPFEDASRYLDQRAGALKSKSVAPGLRDMDKIFRHERSRGCAGLLGLHCVQTHSRREMGKKMGGIADRIAQHNRVEIDKNHAVARQENMVRLQVPMDRLRWNLFQAHNDG